MVVVRLVVLIPKITSAHAIKKARLPRPILLLPAVVLQTKHTTKLHMASFFGAINSPLAS